MSRKFILRVLIIVMIVTSLIYTNATPNKSLQIENAIYKLKVPIHWTVEYLPKNFLLFKENNITIGGLKILGYYEDEPISHLFPNHSEITKLEQLNGYSAEALRVDFILTSPAASKQQTTNYYTFIYFISKDHKRAYTLYFNNKYVNENMFLSIAKSFMLK